MKTKAGLFLLAAALIGFFGAARAQELTVPNTFTAGQKAVASEVNENFTALAAKIQDNSLAIDGLTLQDVNVANDPANPVPVQIQNPQATVTVDNTELNAIPVELVNPQATVTVVTDPSTPADVVVRDFTPILPRMQFAGFSSATTQGDVGLLAMQDICQADFGDTARMCSLDEVAKSATLVAFPGERAWIEPESVSGYAIIGQQSYNVDCILWSRAGTYGSGQEFSGLAIEGDTLTINSGQIYRACTELNHVACCMPQ